jgi:hypothetical protein
MRSATGKAISLAVIAAREWLAVLQFVSMSQMLT